ncbi:MAG: hypothetical protein IT324_26335 [Anaerolineae bacterium]|nr:hypothetical protein [Anaerolineae bacterium]
MQGRSKFILNWTIGTFGGWLIALATAFTIPFAILEGFILLTTQYYRWSTPVWVHEIILVLSVLLSLIIMGLALGLSQWRLALKGTINNWAWIAVSSIVVFGTIISVALAMERLPPMLASYGGNLSGLDVALEVRETWPIGVAVLGIMLGVTIGLPQWLVLRRYFYRAGLWIPANIVGGMTAFVSLVMSAYLLGNAIHLCL